MYEFYSCFFTIWVYGPIHFRWHGQIGFKARWSSWELTLTCKIKLKCLKPCGWFISLSHHKQTTPVKRGKTTLAWQSQSTCFVPHLNETAKSQEQLETKESAKYDFIFCSLLFFSASIVLISAVNCFLKKTAQTHINVDRFNGIDMDIGGRRRTVPLTKLISMVLLVGPETGWNGYGLGRGHHSVAYWPRNQNLLVKGR